MTRRPITSSQVGSAYRQMRRANTHSTPQPMHVRVPRTVIVLAVLAVLAAWSVIPHSGPGPELVQAEAQEQGGIKASASLKVRTPAPNGPWPDWMMHTGTSQMTYEGVAALALVVCGDPYAAVVATAIGYAESSGRTDAVGDTTLVDSTWGPSMGVWQLRLPRTGAATGAAAAGGGMLVAVGAGVLAARRLRTGV